MSMTKTDYELVANVFYKELLDLGGSGTKYEIGKVDEWRALVYLMADKFTEDNPKFKKQLFLEACGL